MPSDGDRRHNHICKAISFWTWYGWKMYDDFTLSFLPMRKLLGSKDQNDGKVNINCFESDFYSAYSCNDDLIIRSKLLEGEMYKTRGIF